MKCNDIKQKLALLIGNDLEDVHVSVVQRHLSECPDCRETHRQLVDSHATLQIVRETSERHLNDSLWPRINAHLPQIYALSQGRSSLGWLPTATLAAACLVLLVFAGSTPLLQPQNQPWTTIDDSSFDVLNDLPTDFGGPHLGTQNVSNEFWQATPAATPDDFVWPPQRKSVAEPLFYRYDDM